MDPVKNELLDCEVLLIQARTRTNIEVVSLPYGLLCVASSLRRRGFRPAILDLNFHEPGVLRTILKKNRSILYVGFSAYTGQILGDILSAAREVRKINPAIPLVWGGPHPTIMPELTLANPSVDIVCVGEGEKTACLIAQALKAGTSLSEIDGLCYKASGRIIKTKAVERVKDYNDTSLGLEHIDLAPYVFLHKGKKTSFFITSRGCPYRCAFCWNVDFCRRVYQAWSIETLSREIQPLLKQGVKKILLLDSFVGSLQRVEAMGRLFSEYGMEWAIEDGCRADYHGSAEFFDILRRTGCTHVTFGAESGSDRILQFLKKDISVEDLIRSARIRPPGIGARYQWMVGVPGETREDVMKTVALIKSINRMNPNSAHSMELYAPLPGCEIYEKALEAGWVPPADLEGWAKNRWEGQYPYHEGLTWFYKSVQYSNIFFNFRRMKDFSAYSSKTKWHYDLAAKMLYPFAWFRWQTGFFDHPWEYQLAEFFRKRVERSR